MLDYKSVFDRLLDALSDECVRQKEVIPFRAVEISYYVNEYFYNDYYFGVDEDEEIIKVPEENYNIICAVVEQLIDSQRFEIDKAEDMVAFIYYCMASYCLSLNTIVKEANQASGCLEDCYKSYRKEK